MFEFKVLAVGVDNIFILVNTLDRIVAADDRLQDGTREAAEEAVAKTAGIVGPSMFMSTCAQATAFFLGFLFFLANNLFMQILKQLRANLNTRIFLFFLI